MTERMGRRQVGEIKREKRIDVQYRGKVVDSEGVSCDVRVLDLSTNGCRVQSEDTLMINERVHLTVGRSGDYPAVVRWSLGGEAGLQFTGPAEAVA